MKRDSKVMRSVLFAPANRRDLVAKLARTGADAAFLDLEDGVAPSGKEDARLAVLEMVPIILERAPQQAVYVRVNSAATSWFADDVAVALIPELTGVVLAKLEEPSQLTALVDALRARGLEHLEIVAGIESAAGVVNVDRLLVAPVTACYFGAEDYIADIGGRRTKGSLEVLFARSKVALAARLADVYALDQVVVELSGQEHFIEDAEQGRALGYQGKICIHPSQIPLTNAVFSPTVAEIDRSRRLLAVHEEASRQGVGAVAFEGVMVDEPLVRQARRVMALASAVETRVLSIS